MSNNKIISELQNIKTFNKNIKAKETKGIQKLNEEELQLRTKYEKLYDERLKFKISLLINKIIKKDKTKEKNLNDRIKEYNILIDEIYIKLIEIEQYKNNKDNIIIECDKTISKCDLYIENIESTIISTLAEHFDLLDQTTEIIEFINKNKKINNKKLTLTKKGR